jgi:gas vesicle protein
MAQEQNNGFGTTLLAFALGAAIGGGLALLTAPRSGGETREKLQGMMDDTHDKLNEMTEEAEIRVKKAIQDGKDILGENADLIKAAIKAGKDAIAAEKAKQKETA